MGCICEDCERIRTIPAARVPTSWSVPGTRWHDSSSALDAYPYFMWLWHRAVWRRQSRIGWPLERRTHYLATDMRKRGY